MYELSFPGTFLSTCAVLIRSTCLRVIEGLGTGGLLLILLLGLPLLMLCFQHGWLPFPRHVIVPAGLAQLCAHTVATATDADSMPFENATQANVT